MNRHISITVALVVAVVCSVRLAAAQPVAEPDTKSPRTPTSGNFLLGPPTDNGPVEVRASFEIDEISAINDETETFEFTGVLTLRWRDKRQAFDPAAAGVKEKNLPRRLSIQ